MKKILTMILCMCTMFLGILGFTGCGVVESLDMAIENAELKEEKDTLNAVIDELTEKVEAGTAVVIDEEVFEDGKLLVVDATKTYFFNDCKFEGKFTVSDKSTSLVFIDCKFKATQDDLYTYVDVLKSRFVNCTCSAKDESEPIIQNYTVATPQVITESCTLTDLEIVVTDTDLENTLTAVKAVGDGVEVTINSGNYHGGTGSAWNVCVWAREGAVVNIVDGYFEVGLDKNGNCNSTIYASHGSTINISGGTFFGVTDENGNLWTLNCQDNSGSSIVVTGGTFVDFDPSNCVTEGVGTNFVAEGYKVVSVEEDGHIYYTVVSELTE